MTIYEIILERILNSLEKGDVPWQSPYSGALFHQNMVTRIPYRGINQ
ncbi:MAG: ArdC-like ssDNA-binding domain-containing protein, partial [Thermodesulfobium sp.]